MTSSDETRWAETARRNSAENIFRIVADGVLFLLVLGFSAVAVITIAFAAPIALGLSALANIFAPSRERSRWRQIQPA